MPKFTFKKIKTDDGERFKAFADGAEFGEVFTVTVPDREYSQWQFEGNPYPRATYRSKYWAARKMWERKNDTGRASRIAELNGR